MSTDTPLIQPPHSVEAEEAVLGSILINPDALHEVASFLRADDFYLVRNGWVWEAIMNLQERNEQIDYLTVVEELRRMNRLDEVGGPAYITHLINHTPSTIYTETYGRIVERAALRRRMLKAASEIASLAHKEDADFDEIIEQAENALFSVTERRLHTELVPIEQAVTDYYDRMEQLYNMGEEAMGVPTGFNDLDALLGGLQKSDLLIVAGRPGMGKTSWLLTVALNAARRRARVVVFSMEMSNEQIVQRLIAAETGISTRKLRLGQLNETEWATFVKAIGDLGRLPIYLDDTPALSPLQLRAKARRLYKEHGLDLIMVDYLQLMTSGNSRRADNRVQEISFISRTLKQIARELNVPLLAAAQLSRAVEQRQDKHPQLADLRESGCLSGETQVWLPETGRRVTIRELAGRAGFRVMAWGEDAKTWGAHTVTRAFCTGVKPVFRLEMRSGQTIRATANHKFLTPRGWKRLDALTVGERLAMPPSDGDFRVRRVEWGTVERITPDGVADVYDLTVPGPHNFVANGLLVHNSIEQDADVVMFIYRDEVYNEETERPNQADVIVAKHRNGPTGTVSLYFRKERTQFTDMGKKSIDVGQY